jgi:hypothetical protein
LKPDPECPYRTLIREEDYRSTSEFRLNGLLRQTAAIAIRPWRDLEDPMLVEKELRR